MIIKEKNTNNIKLLFVYKHNSQDPTQKSLLNTFPRFIKNFYSFCFKPHERRRFSPENLFVSQKFIDVVTELNPTHIFMWLVYLNPEEIQWCKDRNIKMIAAINGFASFSTGLYKSRNMYIESLRLLDIFFIPHEPHIKRMKLLGINAIELPFSFDPDTFKPLNLIRALSSFRNDFFFVGNFGKETTQCKYRIEMLKNIADAGKLLTVSDIKIIHPNIRHLRPIPYEIILNLLANLTKFLICSDFFPDINEYSNLNESEVLDYDVDYLYAIRPRVYTMLGCGSPVIIERHHQLQRFFEDEKHLIMWTDYDELKDKISFYKRHTTNYKKIINNAQSYINESHTISNRIKEVILPAIINIT